MSKKINPTFIVPYSNDSGDYSAKNEIAYCIMPGDKIVLTGIHDGNLMRRRTTAQCLPEVILAIVKNHGIQVRGYSFFDLRTGKGYGKNQFPDGKCQLVELKPRWLSESDMRPYYVQEGIARCDEEICRQFADFIGFNSDEKDLMVPSDGQLKAIYSGSMAPHIVALKYSNANSRRQQENIFNKIC